MKENTLNNKVAIVTGSAGGLGRAFALALSKAGAQLCLADIDETGAQETKKLIEKEGGTAIVEIVDICSLSSVERMTENTVEAFGSIDILINNAAIYATLKRQPFHEIDPDEWNKVMEVNVKGVWLCCRSVFPHMKKNGGKIINIASATVMSGSPLWSHYVASKGAVISLSRSLARELGDYNINVNTIAPGFTLTEASYGLLENASEYGVDRGAIKRASQADDMIGAALFFASKESDFITGQTLIVDGGRQFL